LDLQLALVVQGGDVQIRVVDGDTGRGHDVAGRDGSRSLLADVHGDRLVLFRAHHETLEVQDDVGDILLHAGNGGELVEHAVDADAGDSGARDRREQGATKRVAEGVPEARVERLDDELRAVFSDALFGQCGSLRDEHLLPPCGRPPYDALVEWSGVLPSGRTGGHHDTEVSYFE